eukprot:Phypoly_transcript_04490.p1 GENE.Phypoly_transcript_04490~~Phypoly_transcript_04490.p1  ORF type:complete len:645 (+),score=141.24 Phypoly_transcript_04490:154-2088(+)
MPIVDAFQALSVSNDPPKERPRFEPTVLQLLQTLSQSIVQIKSHSPIKISAEEVKTQHNDIEEFTLVNRDLYLWCDALEESQLSFDVFMCSQDITSATTHTLLERWTLRGNPIASSSPPTSPIQAEDNPFAADSPNTHSFPPPSPQREEEEEKLAEFGKYLSSLINAPSTDPKLSLHEPSEDDTPTKIKMSRALDELHSYVRTMPLHKWMRNNTQPIHQMYGTSRSGPSPLAFVGVTATHDFPPFMTRCSSFTLSVSYISEVDWESFRNEDRRKISLIIAPSRSWSTAACHIKSHHTLPIPLSIPSAYPLDSDPSSASYMVTPPSTPPRSIGFHLPSPSPLSTSPTGIPITRGFFPASTPSIFSRSPTKPYPIQPPAHAQQSFNVSALSSSLRSPTRVNPTTPLTIPTTPPSQAYPSPSPTSSSSAHPLFPLSTPPRSTAIRIPGKQPLEPTSPSSVDLMGALGGSFQESILLGHMSSTSSTTFPGFMADLGVSGKDFIPPHKRTPFSAIYYHVDPDTPYVGTVELGEKGYRVPQKGLIQLTIFNPKNTPVKTFLVNFDLTGMTPDTKTFLRQKIVTSDPPILRYAIHLRIVCPRKKRFYLYNNIRVVFPHRVPDEMEKLKVLYDAPSDPKFFPWTETAENIYH